MTFIDAGFAAWQEGNVIHLHGQTQMVSHAKKQMLSSQQDTPEIGRSRSGGHYCEHAQCVDLRNNLWKQGPEDRSGHLLT